MLEKLGTSLSDRQGPEPETLAAFVRRIERNLDRLQKLMEGKGCGKAQRRYEKAMRLLFVLKQDAYLVGLLHARAQDHKRRTR
jgi:hypothetical protein